MKILSLVKGFSYVKFLATLLFLTLSKKLLLSIIIIILKVEIGGVDPFALYMQVEHVAMEICIARVMEQTLWL